MVKKILNQLINYSYVDNKLNRDNVRRVAKVLRRRDLKQYIHGLKKQEGRLNVFIDVPMSNFEPYKDRFKKMFQNKKIIWNIDPSLWLGIRIMNDDKVLEMSLRNTLSNLILYLEENYD